MKIIIITTIILSLGIACKKNSDYKPFSIPCTLSASRDDCQRQIVGTWEWIETEVTPQVGGPGSEYITPESSNRTMAYQFKSDTAFYFESSSLVRASTYKVAKEFELSGAPGDSTAVLVLYQIPTGLLEEYVPIRICENYLVIQYQKVSSTAGQTIWKKR